MVDNYYNNIKNIMSGYGKMLSDTAPKARKSTQDIMKQIMTELNKLESSGKSVAKDISANYKTKITPTQARNIVKEAIGSNASKQAAKKAVQSMKYLPIVGSAVDIGEGLYQATHGHPYAGLFQTALGTAGLPLSVASGGIGGTVAKAGARAVNKYLAKGAGKYLLSTPGRLSSTALVNLDYLFNKDKKSKKSKDSTGNDNNASDSIEEFNIDRELGNNIPVVRQTYIPTSNMNTTGKSDGITDIILRNTNNGNGYNQSIEQQPVTQQQVYDNQQYYTNGYTQPQVQQERMDYSKALLDAITNQERYNSQQYLNSLDTYRRQLPWAKSADFFSKLAGAGYAKALNNPYLADLGPIGAEDLATAYPNVAKQRADITNSLLNAQVGRYANMQAASDAGLNTLTGLSDKSVLQQVGGIKKANTAADTKRYSTDRYFEGRQLAAQIQLQIQQMKNAIQEKLLDRTLSTKERMQLRDLQAKLSIEEQRNATNIELGRMGAMSRPYTMGIGLTPEYGKLFGVNYGSKVSPDVGGIDPNVINSLINR